MPFLLSPLHKQRQSGLAFLTVLIFLAILSTLAFAFIFRVGVMNRMTLGRVDGMQAHYLAETAVNHAVWGLLNQPGFAPAADTYYMHALANGRYGYKVRKPTETTFATIATVGAMDDSVVHQSYVPYIIPSNILTGYGQTVSQIPQYRRLIGAQWTDANDIGIGSVPSLSWMQMAGCPLRKEIIVGVLDSNDDITTAVWDGTQWGSSTAFTTSADASKRSFDIAYESQSGRALVVGRYDATTGVRHNIWDGTGWLYNPAQPAFNLDSGALSLVTMASCPGNDDILIATVSWNYEMKLFHWDGTVFTDLGMLEGSMDSDLPGGVEIVYERQSGDALIIWHATGDMRYQVWNGVSLGTPAVIPGFTSDVNVLRVAEDPTSDVVVVVGLDKFYDITVAVWDGDAWIDNRKIFTDCADNNGQSLDVAWETSGQQAIVTFAGWNQSNIRYFAWEKGTALADSAVQHGPNFEYPWRVRLLPMAGTDKIILLGHNFARGLYYALWDGQIFKGDPGVLLETNISNQNLLAFDLAEADVPISGGTGTGVTGANTPPVVDAGPDQTLVLPLTQASLDGTVTDDGLPSPPATVTTSWSLVSGPGPIVFDDASLVDTIMKVGAEGDYVLRLTADDSELSAFDDVTITVSSCTAGNFLDAFTTAAYNNSDGSLAWNTVWEETGESDGSSTGKLSVINSPYCAAGNCLQIRDDSAWSAQLSREIDLASMVQATLSLSYRRRNVGIPVGGQVTLDISGDGGASFTILKTYQLTVNDPAHIVDNFDITPYLASNTQIRFSTGEASFENAFYVDNVEIVTSCELPCNADYTPDTKVGEFSTSAYGSSNIRGITYLPAGKVFRGITSPADGAWITVDDTSDIQMIDMAGNLMASCPFSPTNPEGITLVKSGLFADTLAVLTANMVTFVDFNCSAGISMFTSSFGANLCKGIVFIESTASALYDEHLAILDTNINDIYIVDQSGNVKTTIDISSVTANATDLGHIPGTDTLMFTDPIINAVFRRAFDGTGLGHYFYTSSGATGAEAITINPQTCDHVIGADGTDNVIYMNSGAATDNDPPAPDPMTWASPPAAAGPFSITMTATTATDPSGVEYYFECTAGGGSHSGWQDSPTYVDNGLSASSTYTYRVKARDKSTSQNETGWSTDASATTSSNEIYVHDIAMGFRKQGQTYFGQATVWIKGAGGGDIEGAIVSAEWGGSVTGTSMGTTASSGQISLESPGVKGGGTFKFGVNGVVKAGYVYNPALNVESTDGIVLP